MWVALGWYVPAVLIAHVAIIDQLLRGRLEARSGSVAAG
jgi:hypothetical protein